MHTQTQYEQTKFFLQILEKYIYVVLPEYKQKII